jgi:ABC-2 type transport system permease protein
VVRDLRAALRSEWIKLRTVRSTAIFVGLTAVIGVGMALILGKFVETDPYDHLPFTIGNTFLVSSWLTTLFAVVAGTLLFTSEVQHGTLAGALTARPSKRIIVGAKAIVAAALGFAMGARHRRRPRWWPRQRDGHRRHVGCRVGHCLGARADHAGSGAGARCRPHHSPQRGSGDHRVGVGARCRDARAWHGVGHVSRLLPFAAAHGLLGTRSAADTPETLAAALSNVQNAAVIGCWAAVTVAIGTALLIRQDA